MEELIFIGVNLEKWLKREVDRVRLTVTRGMTDNEMKAYDLGIENLFNLFKGIAQVNDNEVLIHLEKKNDTLEEFDYEDLLDYIEEYHA